MGFAGYVSVCVQLYSVGFHRLSLYVSVYMAIFKCVGCFIFVCLKDFASLLFFLPFSRGHTHEGKQEKTQMENMQSVTT
jgi:hypothetical protein